MNANSHPAHVFLTGASSGIGLESVRLLTSHGFVVWGTSRSFERLPKIPNFHPVVMDLTDSDSIRDGFALALKQAGHFDILINNSGAGHFGPIESQPAELVREQFQLMVHGPLELIRLTLPQMRQRQRGLILNVTSLASRFPIPYLGIYSSTKAALASLSETLRYELAHTPIRVIDLQPGDINTNFHAATRQLETKLGPADQTRIRAAWETITCNMAIAPAPRLVAEAVLRIVTSANPPPVVAVGGFFQAKVGPFLTRFAPRRSIEWFLRRYYRI